MRVRGRLVPWRRGVIALAVACALALPAAVLSMVAVPGAAFAQVAVDRNDPRQQELDAVYEKLLVDPTDAGLNRRLAELALELGDLDAAIGAIERLVFLYPDDVSLQIEVARLYVRLESYAAARGYLNDALQLASVTSDERAQIEGLLEEIDVATRPPLWSGIAQVGFRYQSNANIGPSELGAENQLPVEDPISDFNAFALGTLAYGNQLNDNLALEATLAGLYADQFKVDRLDIGYVEGQAGPRFIWHDGRASLKPYALGQAIMLGSDLYQLTYGGGVSARFFLDNDVRLVPEFEYKNRTFYASDDYGSAPDQTGEQFALTLNSDGKFSDRTFWSARGSFNLNDAAEDYQSYEQFIGQVGLTFDFDVGDWEGWKLSPYARVIFTNHQGVAPQEELLEFDTIREDFQWSVGASLEVPVTEFTSLGAQVQYIVNDSTLSRYTYENLQVLLGPIGRF